MFSKFAFLVFGAIITAAFFFFIAAQKDMQEFDAVARTSESVSNILGMAAASPFSFSVEYRPDLQATLNFTDDSFEISSGKKSLRHAVYFPIKTNGTVRMDRCINITKTNVTEVFECQ